MSTETIVGASLLVAAFVSVVQLIRIGRYDNALYAFVLAGVLTGAALAGCALLNGGIR